MARRVDLSRLLPLPEEITGGQIRPPAYSTPDLLPPRHPMGDTLLGHPVTYVPDR